MMNNLRMLLLPSLEKYKDEDSSLLLLKCLADVAVRRGWGVHLAVPMETPLYGWNQRVHVHRVNYPVSTRQIAAMNVCQPLAELVHTGLDSLMVHSVVTTDSLAGYLGHLYLQQELMNFTPKIYTLVASSAYMGSDELVGRGDARAFTAAYAMGCAAAVNYQPTQFMKSRLLDLGRAYLGAHLFEELEQNTRVSSIGPWCSKLDEVKVDKKRQRFSFYYGGRFTHTKGGQNAVRQFIRFIEGGRDADVIISAVGNFERLRLMLKREGGAGVVQIFTKMSAEDAWRLMSECHVSMFYQSLKILPSSPYEQLYCGLAVAFKDRGYEKVLLPPDYPYIFQTELEGATLLRWIYDNYDRVSAEVPRWAQWIRDNLDRELAYSSMLEQMEEELSEWRNQQRKRIRHTEVTLEQMERVLSVLGDGAQWRLILDGMKSQKVSIVHAPHVYTSKGLTALTLYRLFVPDEWQDIMEEPMPVMRRGRVLPE